MEFNHYSVLLNETIENLNIKPDGIYVDGTLGGGGHAYQVASRLSEKGRLIGIDQDLDAIAAATERLKDYKDRVTIVHSNYQDIDAVLKNCSVSGVDGIVLDLGVSSYQLDNVERGFTYREDTPLDMRMNQESTMTAKDIVNEYSEMELYHVIRDYGEDSFAKNIAKHDQLHAPQSWQQMLKGSRGECRTTFLHIQVLRTLFRQASCTPWYHGQV